MTSRPSNRSEPKPKPPDLICDGFAGASGAGGRLFATLGAMYGRLWVKEHGSEPSAEFNAWSLRLTEKNAQRVIQRAREYFINGVRFPPPLGELIVWSEMPNDREITEMLFRVLARQYVDEIEKWLVVYRRYDLIRVPESEQIKTLRRYYEQAKTLERRGELFPKIPALTVKPEISVAERARMEYERRGGVNPFQSRIDRLLSRN